MLYSQSCLDYSRVMRTYWKFNKLTDHESISVKIRYTVLTLPRSELRSAERLDMTNRKKCLAKMTYTTVYKNMCVHSQRKVSARKSLYF